LVATAKGPDSRWGVGRCRRVRCHRSSVNRIAMGTQSSPMSVAWCGLAHHTTTVRRSRARPGRQPGSGPVGSRVKSATFGVGWLSRQVGQVRGLLVRANSFPRACAACPGYRGREIELGFVAGQRPLQGHGGVDELGLLRLVEVAVHSAGAWWCTRRVPGSRFGERLDGQLPTSRLVAAGRICRPHTGCARSGPAGCPSFGMTSWD
jgi:hypothetical protein